MTRAGRFQRWVPVRPRRGLLHLAGHPDEQVLPAVGRDQLHADRQAGGRPVQREAHRRLAGRVELRGVGHEAGDPAALLLGAGRGEPAKLRRRGTGRGRDEQVVPGPPVRHAPCPSPEPLPGLQVRHRGQRLPGPPVVRVARLDLCIGDRPAEHPLERLEHRFGVGGDHRVEVPGEPGVEHARGPGLLDAVTQRLQQPPRGGHRRPALRIVGAGAAAAVCSTARRAPAR